MTSLTEMMSSARSGELRDAAEQRRQHRTSSSWIGERLRRVWRALVKADADTRRASEALLRSPADDPMPMQWSHTGRLHGTHLPRERRS
jgi:hypothetical protein